MQDLKNRRGVLIVSREHLTSWKEDIYRALYSNFFPLAMDNENRWGAYDRVSIYGVSPFFEVVEEGAMAPEYHVMFTKSETGVFYFSGFKKTDPNKTTSPSDVGHQ